MKFPAPNRIAVYLTALSGVAGAIAVPVANLDTTSTASVIAGVAAIVTAAVAWLKGWQAHEHRQATAVPPVLDADDSIHAATDGDPSEPVVADPTVAEV